MLNIVPKTARSSELINTLLRFSILFEKARPLKNRRIVTDTTWTSSRGNLSKLNPVTSWKNKPEKNKKIDPGMPSFKPILSKIIPTINNNDNESNAETNENCIDLRVYEVSDGEILVIRDSQETKTFCTHLTI